MVADDSRFIRALLTRLLTENGYEVIEAEGGEEAIQAYRQVCPDAVLMDIAMPGKNGSVALYEICSFDPNAKIIILSPLDQQLIILRAMQAGAKDFLIKPFDPERVLIALDNVLRSVS